jgi:exonuclease SbcC
MVPVKLALRNFMCYRDNVSPLYFDGIHVACLCGDNGNGKSALLDAITWALWGKARARSDDELIHLGQREMEVEFEFVVGSNHYRVLRKRAKSRLGRPGQTVLELQLATSDGFRSIGGNSIGETQQKIIHILRMDYTTFINSAFLRQGHADEFTIKPPGERKKVLADILGLSLYDELEEQAKSYTKEKEQKEKELASAIKEMEQEIERKGEYEAELLEVRKTLIQLDKGVKSDESQVIALRDAKKAVEFKQEQLAQLQQNISEEEEELNYWRGQVSEHSHKVEEYEGVLMQRSDVEKGYAQLEQAKKETEEMSTKMSTLVTLTEHKAALDKVLERSRGELITEQKLLQNKVKELEVKSQKLPRLEGELAQLQTKFSEILEQQKGIEGKRQRAQQLALQIQYLKSANTQLRQEIEQLWSKLTLLRQGDVRCPLCETELGVAGKQRIEGKYKAEVENKAEIQRNNETQLKEGEDEHQQLEHEINQSELRINREQVAIHREMATLEKEIGEAKEAADKLIGERAYLAESEGRLAKGDFALTEQKALKEVEQQLASLEYIPQRLKLLRELLADLEKYEGLWRILKEAEKFLPRERAALMEAEETLSRKHSILESSRRRATALSAEIAVLPELADRLRQAEQAYNLLLGRQAESQKRVGACQQKLDHCSSLERAKEERRGSLIQISREKGIYAELAGAFGKKGIQAFIIESAIPEVEQEANRLLGRMTDNRMQVKIETQRETKKGETIETLDIKISDELGVRSYEMYSGGEAFRINFALRIALSKLLARRAGAPLLTLIIDEGFGTQDQSGLGKLVEAINSIGDDFEKVIVITHLAELKDDFPACIEVTKTATGSQILVS